PITPQIYFLDIWDGPIIRNFIGPDGKHFFEHSRPEAHLLFGIGYDGFNPFHNKQAGKKASICVVNGPKLPALTETNHYLRPIIDHFHLFWSVGFQFTETPLYPKGCLSRGAIVPMIMDLSALQQITGTGSHEATFFCTFCL
ncbi:hypothetical protein K439DRAFT_1345899, partial [Ramaria rubella]